MLKKILITIFIFVFTVNATLAVDDFNLYIKSLKKDIDRVWNAPVFKKKYTSDVYFKVMKDGCIQDIRLAKSSQNSKLDRIALLSIKNLYKQNPLPESYNSDYIEIIVSLTNYLYSDLRNPNIMYKAKKIELNNITPVSTRFVKIKKVVYLEPIKGNSNYKDNMKELELNLSIQNALKSNI